VLNLLARVIDDRALIISVGGVETAAEVSQRLAAGATLVQGYSGFIYEGPLWARKIKSQLIKSAK
jgi:dihydroorotate dehydrogenase